MFPPAENELYLLRYQRIINSFVKNPIQGIFEKHHIIPKCMGGGNLKDNIVCLSPKAHYICHLLLMKAYPNNKKLKHAFAMMVVNNGCQFRMFSSRQYEKAKEARVKALTGVSRPEWVKQKLRRPKTNKSNYYKPKSKEHAENISKSLKGKQKPPMTDKTKILIGKATKGNTYRRNKTIYNFSHSILGNHTCTRYELCMLFPELKLRSERLSIQGYKGWNYT